VIQIGIGDTRVDTGTALWGTARWNTAGDEWSGAEPLWLDVTCDSFSAEFAYGRQRNTDAFAPGTANVAFQNLSGWGDPSTAGEEPAVLTLRPGRAIRIGVDHAVDGRVWLWRGFVDAVMPIYDPTDVDRVELEAICALGEVGRVQLAEVAVGVGDGEMAGTRVRRILDVASWPASKRDIDDDTGVVMLPTVFGEQVVDMFVAITDSVGGSIYGDTQGRVAFRGREWQSFVVGTPPDATIGNIASATLVELPAVEAPAGSGLYTPPAGTTVSESPAGSGLYTSATDYVDPDGDGLFYFAGVAATGDVCPSSWEMSSRRNDIVTRIALGRETDDVPKVYNDPTGQALYGVETWEATDLVCASSAQLDLLASRLFRTRGYLNTPRVERVRLEAATADAVVDLITRLDVFAPSRYRCRLGYDRGVVFDTEMFATGVAHMMTPESWTVDVDLDSAKPYRQVTNVAHWDTARWGEHLFAAGLTARLDEELDAMTHLVGVL
jgi:hypothetical protein